MMFLGLMLLIASAYAMPSNVNLEQGLDVNTLTALKSVAAPLDQPENSEYLINVVLLLVNQIINQFIQNIPDPYIIQGIDTGTIQLGNGLTVAISSTIVTITGLSGTTFTLTGSLSQLNLNFVIPALTVDFGPTIITITSNGEVIPVEVQGTFNVAPSTLNLVLGTSGLSIVSVTANFNLGQISATPTSSVIIAGVDVTDFVVTNFNTIFSGLSNVINPLIANIILEALQNAL